MCNIASESNVPPALPADLRRLFWDCDFRTLSWKDHQSFIVGRVLSDGTWSDVKWLRERIGDDALRDWIISREGGPLSPKQLRFWELILHIPRDVVDEWLNQEPRRLWFGGLGT